MLLVLFHMRWQQPPLGHFCSARGTTSPLRHPAPEAICKQQGARLPRRTFAQTTASLRRLRDAQESVVWITVASVAKSTRATDSSI